MYVDFYHETIAVPAELNRHLVLSFSGAQTNITNLEKSVRSCPFGPTVVGIVTEQFFISYFQLSGVILLFIEVYATEIHCFWHGTALFSGY